MQVLVFFFSSRRRHTRFDCDWSSDVCSSDLGQKLYNMLVAPAQKLIPKGSHIAVIPSGSLYELNFETLLVPDPQLHYWIEDVVITNASSLLLLRGSASAREGFADKRLLLIGDPVSS